MTTILVADDVPENRYFLGALLRGHGYDVVPAVDGAEALRLARASPPALAITDLMMPVMDGFELCRRWKRDAQLGRVPLVVYTATYTDPKDERLALSLGADRFLVKPLRPEALLAAVREVLEAARREPSAVRPGAPADGVEHLQRHNEALQRKLEKKVAELEGELARSAEIEAALREKERRYRLLAENSSDVVWSMGLDGRLTYVSPSVQRLLGHAPAALLSMSSREVLGDEGFAVLQAELAGARAELAAGREPRPRLVEIEQRRRDGSRVWTEVAAGVMRDEAGELAGVLGVTRDVTERRRAEQAMREAEAEQRRLRDELLQAQKLESIGRLAGGVAHDFNNLMTAVLTYSDFALAAVREGDPLRADLLEIHRAGERAAALTRKLLAFSRKQVLEPQVLALNKVVAGIENMLRRLLGEDVQVEVRLAEGLGRVMADPGQIEQVIMNLAVNARDAMPGGGRLTIETENVDLDEVPAAQHAGGQAGPHVMLAVTDTGTGMDEATRERIFEPFFTTKRTGKGTGLGLSTVYGIVKQSGGGIRVESAPGRGTAFRVYLPRVDAPETQPRRPVPAAPQTGKERVLIVEDEETVRNIAERVLHGAGYDVRSAAGAGDALLISEKRAGAIDLLVTDVLMPQMNGPELAARLQKLNPLLKVLYMSGYPGDELAEGRGFEPGTRFLGKPFVAAELTRKVREVLDGS